MESAADTVDFDREVRLHLYGRFLAEGRPPSPAEAADAMGSSPEAVESAYRRLAEERVIVLHPGTTEVWMANPLSAMPTPFTVEVGDRSYFGNCAWDALGVVAMLGGTGRVYTACPDCGQPVEVTVSGGQLSSEAAEATLHFAVPAAHWWDDIGYT